MPYIPNHTVRKALDDGRFKPKSAGELNYAITRLVTNYLRGDYGYDQLNEAIGVLECSKLELYRRMVAPYEDAKCAENGDVYPS